MSDFDTIVPDNSTLRSTMSPREIQMMAQEHVKKQILVAGGLILFFVFILVVLSAYIEGKRCCKERREKLAQTQNVEMNNLLLKDAEAGGTPKGIEKQ
ncbi:hypothetical protein QR680_013853 [Steinernema hermaphroditum]|uniref:Uncharacterized protein n=1 Tax=Steinernema hermaphroditum TaxID=289476 RepID=A0AA39M2Y3_9BILA|nr:hypothetical protein QR680_013853 [Steinernema hermaphroditum]